LCFYTWGRSLNWSISWWLGNMVEFKRIIDSNNKSWIPDRSIQKSKKRRDVDDISSLLNSNCKYSLHTNVSLDIRDNLLKDMKKIKTIVYWSIKNQYQNLVVFSWRFFNVLNCKLDRRFLHASWSFFNILLFNNWIWIKKSACSPNAGWAEICSPFVKWIINKFFVISILSSTLTWANGGNG